MNSLGSNLYALPFYMAACRLVTVVLVLCDGRFSSQLLPRVLQCFDCLGRRNGDGKTLPLVLSLQVAD